MALITSVLVQAFERHGGTCGPSDERRGFIAEQLKIITYNVQTLLVAGASVSLAVQLQRMRVHVAMLQECRAGFSGIKSAGNYWRIGCASCSGTMDAKSGSLRYFPLE